MKITRRQLKNYLKNVLAESSYLIGRDFQEVIDELRRIVHEIGLEDALDPADIERFHHYGNMEAIKPYYGYEDGDAILLKVYVDLESYLDGTIIPWTSMDPLNREMFKMELLDAFPDSSFEGNMLVINSQDARDDYKGFKDFKQGKQKTGYVPWWRGPYGMFDPER